MNPPKQIFMCSQHFSQPDLSSFVRIATATFCILLTVSTASAQEIVTSLPPQTTPSSPTGGGVSFLVTQGYHEPPPSPSAVLVSGNIVVNQKPLYQGSTNQQVSMTISQVPNTAGSASPSAGSSWGPTQVYGQESSTQFTGMGAPGSSPYHDQSTWSVPTTYESPLSSSQQTSVPSTTSFGGPYTGETTFGSSSANSLPSSSPLTSVSAPGVVTEFPSSSPSSPGQTYYPVVVLKNNSNVGRQSGPTLDELVFTMTRYNQKPYYHHAMLRIHGILMTIGWTVFLTTGILFARYYRGVCPNTTVCGLFLWFHFHRTLNLIGLACLIPALVCVFVANDWTWTGPRVGGTNNRSWTSMHSILGLLGICLAWVQPMNAVLRCHPQTHFRVLFNIWHGFWGLAALVLSLAALTIACIHFDYMFYNHSAAFGMCITFLGTAGGVAILLELLDIFQWHKQRNNNMSDVEVVQPDGKTHVTLSRQTKALNIVRFIVLIFYIFVALACAVSIPALIGVQKYNHV